jgi:predicted lipoprotein with Yx(FWY)xxD motif
MKRLLTVTALAGGLVLFAACGGDDNAGGSPAATSPGGSAPTVSTTKVADLGTVLVDAHGMALYAADQEADGSVRCTSACTSFWIPLPAGDGTPTAGPGVSDLGAVERPDGTRQVTADGKLLYTFAQDSPGKVTGNGFSDEFGDQHLTWHAVLASGATPTSTAGSSSGTTDPYAGVPGY